MLNRLQQLENNVAELKQLKAMIGLRNILVHEYVAVETEKLYDMLNYLDDFSEFSELISDNPNLIRKDNL